MKRLLAIGHSYCVELNRRLPQEMARAGWDVTVVAPDRFRGDFDWHETISAPDEPCRVVAVPIRFGARVHTMWYGAALRGLLSERWDAVHCWEEPYVASAAQVARAARPDAPLVFATFQNIAKTYPPPFNWIERTARHRANGMVAFGETTREVLSSRGWRQPVRTIPVGVDVNRFAPDAPCRAQTRGIEKGRAIALRDRRKDDAVRLRDGARRNVGKLDGSRLGRKNVDGAERETNPAER